MTLARGSIVTLLSLGFVLSACNTQKPPMTRAERKTLEELKARPSTMSIEPGSYTVTAVCVDAEKNAYFQNQQWVVVLKEDGHYLEKQQNLDPHCKEGCSVVEGGTFKANEAQATFEVIQRLNIETNGYETLKETTQKTYFVMNYDNLFDKLVLVDTSKNNRCQGKMTLTLQK